MTQTAVEYRKFAAFGSGVGIQIRGADLDVAVVRVRPAGVRLLAQATIRNFRERPAAEWGVEYQELLQRAGEGRLSAVVLLPRCEVIVRHLALAGVASRDMQSAIAYQVDSLHPYGEDEIVWGWSAVGPGAALAGMLRRSVLDGYVELFAKAGVPVASFTFSAAAVYGALRLLGQPPAGGFIAVSAASDGPVEVYGESPTRPVFSAAFDAPVERAVMLGISELRLPAQTGWAGLDEILPVPRKQGAEPYRAASAPAYAAALAGACPWLSHAANLLPAALRQSHSRGMYIPTAVLGVVLAVTAAGTLAYHKIADRAYLGRIAAEVARLEPQARQAAALDRRIEAVRARARLLDEFRARTRHDLDALNEMTGILPPPVWASNIDLTRDAAVVSGEAEQAAGLVRIIDASRCFQISESPFIARAGVNELFRIRAARREACK